MNRITIRFLLLMSILALMCAKASAQALSSDIPICSGTSISINSAVTMTGYNFTHLHRVAGGNWSSGLGDNNTTYQFYVPTAGPRYEVQRVYKDGEGNVVGEQALGFYYIPVNPVINVTPSPSTNCAAYNGSINVTDASYNYGEMIRYFTLLDANGSIIKKDSLLNSSYTFGNLAPGTYQVKVETKCGLSDIETVVLEGATVVQANINGVTDVCLGVGTTLTATGGNFYYWSTGATGSSITVAPTTLGSHSYSVTVTAGVCSASDSHVLTASTSTPAQISGPSTVCYNESVTLSTNSVGTYLWSNGATTSSITVTLQDTRTFGLTVTVPGQCPSIGSKTVTVLPAASLNPAPSSICAGSNITLSVSGGATYLWNTGETTASISRNPNVSFEYKVMVTDANGCRYTFSKNVSVESLPNITFGGNMSVCLGQNLDITAFGGATYLWSHNNVTTATITVSPTINTTYTVTATSSFGCSATAQRAITVKQPPGEEARIIGSNSLCAGQIIALTAVGGETYRWSWNNSNANTIYVNPTENTNFKVTITNEVGCQVVRSHSVTLEVSGKAENDGPITCSKTSATLMAISSVQGATYAWKNASGTTIATTVNHTVTTAGVYTLVITGAGGCTYTTATQVLADNQVPVVTANNSGVITCLQPSSNLLGVSNMSPATYEWRNGDGILIASTLNASTTQAGTYTLKVTTPNGCSSTKSTVVTVDQTIPAFTPTNDGPLDCSKTSVTLSPGGTGTGWVYTWKNAAGSVISNSASTTVTTAGIYSLKVTGSNGCENTQNTTVVLNAVLPHGNASNDGPISCVKTTSILQGSSQTPGVTYAWYGAFNDQLSTQQNFTVTAPGTYTLRVTAPDGCYSTHVTTVGTIGPLPLSPSVFNNGPLTCTVGTVSMTASTSSNNVTYEWRNSNGDVIGNSAGKSVTLPGVYSVKITKTGDGCSITLKTQVTENRTNPVAQISGELMVCRGKRTTLTASGGTQYAWSTGATTTSLTTEYIYSPTTFTVSVSKGAYCSTAEASVVVSNHPDPPATITGQTYACSGSSLVLSAPGGYTYKWSVSNQTTQSITVTPSVPTTYYVTVTSDKGCAANDDHRISPIVALPNDFQLSGVPTTPFCGQAVIDIDVINPTPGYTWSWSTGETTTGIEKTLTSSQTISVTAQNNGCTRTKTIPIIVNSPAQGQILGANIVCWGDSTILTAPVGGTYVWSTGATTSSIWAKPNSSQNYSVTVSNGSNCTATFTKTIVVPPALNLTHSITGEDDCISNNVEVIPSVTGGTGNISFEIIRSWQLVTSPILNGLGSGTYLLVATDDNECVDLNEFTIEETPLKLEVLSLTNQSDCIPGNAALSLGTQNAHGPVNISLVPGGPGSIFTLYSGTYKAYAVDSAGCQDSLEVVVVDRDDVEVRVTGYGFNHCDTNDASINLYVEPVDTSAQYQYSLDGGQTWQNNFQFFNLPNGQYNPAVKKLPGGCIILGNAFTLLDTCSRYTLTQDESSSLASLIQKSKENAALTSGNFQSRDVLKVFPNPVMDMLQTEFQLTSNGQMNIRLLNELGKIVQSQSFEGYKGANKINISTLGLPAGIYIIQVLDKVGQLYGVEKVIKM